MFGLNKAADRAVFRPAAIAWRRAVPSPARDGVRNFVSNLTEPVIFLNDVLQAHPDAAAGAASRFGVNSTIGIVGIFDVASQMGVYRHKSDFGQTLGRWGAGSGPYLMLPFFGPSSVRDAFGLAVDTAANPFAYPRFDGDVAAKTSVIVVGALDARARSDKDLKDFQNAATDPYVAARSMWVQNRAYQIRGDKPVDAQSLPDFDQSPAPAAPPQPAAPKP
jgi:phospholipid-binding lipoprotein MlaA